MSGGRLGENDAASPGPNAQPAPKERSEEEVWRDLMTEGSLQRLMEGQRNFDPGYLRSVIPTPEPLSWWQRERFSLLLAVLGTIVVGGLVALLVVTLIARGILPGDRPTQARMEQRLTPTLDICAVKLPLTQGRLLKTQGEVLRWGEAKDGGIDLYLVKEIDGGLSCGMKAHLPPTIPETTWRPTSGERVTLCGLMEASKYQARMVAAWRCM